MDSKSARVSEVYVWSQTKGTEVVAGKFEHRNGLGVFFYADSYIAREDAFALDPINLPLVGRKEFTTMANGGYFGVLLDAGPDNWGQRVLSLLSPFKPRNPLEFLLASNADGVGSLLFSMSRSRTQRPQLRGRAGDIEMLERAAQGLLKDEDIPEDVRKAMVDSSSLGGARPKASVLIDGVPYIAKFSKTTDLYSEVLAEKATFTMAREAGFDVPDHRSIKTSQGRDILLVRRFDFDPDNLGQKLHYISANSLMNLHKVQESNPDCGYPGLATHVRMFADEPMESSKELFRRMSYRVLVGDTDDHGRNHGFLRRGGRYYHAPMFDVLPHIDNTELQAMPIGRQGRARTLQNLLSMTESFGLTKDEAAQIVRNQRTVVKHWRDFFSEAGVSNNDMRLIAPSFSLESAIDNEFGL